MLKIGIKNTNDAGVYFALAIGVPTLYNHNISHLDSGNIHPMHVGMGSQGAKGIDRMR